MTDYKQLIKDHDEQFGGDLKREFFLISDEKIKMMLTERKGKRILSTEKTGNINDGRVLFYEKKQ